MNRRPPPDMIACVGSFDTLAELRVVGFPDNAAILDGRTIDRTLQEDQLLPGVGLLSVGHCRLAHLDQSASLFVLFRMSFVEHHSIARLDGHNGAGGAMLRVELDKDAIARLANDEANPHAATLGKTPFYETLMVDALQESGGKAAGKTLRQIELTLAR